MWYSPGLAVLLARCDLAVCGGRLCDLASVGGWHYALGAVGASAATWRCGRSPAGVAGDGQVGVVVVGSGRSGGDGASH